MNTQIVSDSERANEVRSALARREYVVRQEITSEAWTWREQLCGMQYECNEYGMIH
jgi:hypothetical protein